MTTMLILVKAKRTDCNNRDDTACSRLRPRELTVTTILILPVAG